MDARRMPVYLQHATCQSTYLWPGIMDDELAQLGPRPTLSTNTLALSVLQGRYYYCPTIDFITFNS